MSRVIVAYASRMGSTREIAEVVADELRQTDHTVTIAPCSAAPDAAGFDAAIIGSALYGRRWMPDAEHYVRRQARHLTNRPTYLFQSGPCRVATPASPRWPVHALCAGSSAVRAWPIRSPSAVVSTQPSPLRGG